MKMNKEYVDFAVAKELKEKGFPQKKEDALAMYNEDGCFLSLCTKDEEYYLFEDFDEYDCVCPTYEQVMNWIREEKGIHIYCYIGKDWDTDADGEVIGGWNYWAFCIMDMSGEGIDDDWIDTLEYDSYEKACEGGIKYCLEKLI